MATHDKRMGDVDDAELLDPIGIPSREPPGDRRSPIMSDHERLLAPCPIHEPEHVVAQRVQAVGCDPGRFIAEIVAPLIGGQNAKALGGEKRKLAMPSVPEFGKSVKKDEQWSVLGAGRRYVKTDAVDSCVQMFDRSRVHEIYPI